MLPSTGYFKALCCPFYDSGLCERPYCHFRHVKKEAQVIGNDRSENGIILQQLVSEAVKKVLQKADIAGTSQQSQLNDSIIEAEDLQPVNSKVTYNPTPIAELNKFNDFNSDNVEETSEHKRRHIPVPYTPRKPATLPIKRPTDTNGSTKPFIYMPPTTYTPGSKENAIPDTYQPKGTVASTDRYLPGSEKELQAYTPVETKLGNKLNYVPTDKSDNNSIKTKLVEYKPFKTSSKADTPRVTYQPTPLSLMPCFSSDEEELEVKKKRLSNDINNLDGLESEFEILDQILHEEKNKVTKKEKEQHSKKPSKSNETTSKSVDRKSDIKKSDSNKVKTSSEKNKDVHKSRHSDKKSSHKSSHKERYKEKSKDKESSDKSKHHSNSKSSEKTISKNHHSSSSRHSSKSKSRSNESEKDKHKDEKKSRDKHKTKDKHRDKPSQSEHKSNDDSDSLELMEVISESDEDTIASECKRIFEEYVPTHIVKNIEETVKTEDASMEYIPSKKRVSRTADKNIRKETKTLIKPNFKVNAAQAMAERVAKIREYHVSKQTIPPPDLNTTEIKKDVPKNSFNIPSGNSKIRIAHVPYASNMLNAKKVMSKPVVNKIDPSASTTIQTLKKGAQRTAHVPNEKFIDRPGVLEPLASKIAANIRSTYLNMMIDECLKIYLTATDAYARAQHEELVTSKKCSTVQIYKNSAVLAVSRLRKEILECDGVLKSASDCSMLQKLPDSKSGVPVSWSIEKNKKNTNITHEFIGERFYKNISKWILSEDQLQENGFPISHPNGDKGRAMIHKQNSKQKPPKGLIRICTRCRKEYTVDKKGLAVIKEECIYHPNNKYRFRGEVKYQCCSQEGTSDGCCVAPSHVFDFVDYENLKGYVKTLVPGTSNIDNGVYALDCEMCYTSHGLDLTRITVINSSCKVVYETLIKPLHPIIDYNTRYSGITEDQMVDVKTNLLDVQATLLSLFNSKTILIGHSLESDFKALKLIHGTVIDTSVLFPHKMGPPYKRALRNLCSEYLSKIIQNSVDGHDSAEDATVCMELIHYKLKEDLKTR